MLHTLRMCRMLLELKKVKIWSSKKAKSLLKAGVPVRAINEHGIRVGYIACSNDNNFFIDKTGKQFEIPVIYQKWIG